MSGFGVPPVPPVPPQPGSWPQAAEIAQDVVCRKCGYNLRGLSADGRCPECGTAVGYSLQGDLLRFCNPDWVDTLHRGARLFIWGVVLLVLGAILAGTMKDSSIGSFAGIINLGGWALMTVGWWLMTEPDPSGLGEERYGTARKVIRIALIVSVVQQLIQVAVPFMLSNITLSTLIALGVVQFVLGVVSLVGFFAQLNFMKKLAMRIPDPKLSGRSHFLMIAIPASYGVLIVIGLLMLLAVYNAGASAGSSLMSFGCAAGIAGVCVIIFGIMYLLLVEKMGKRFKEQAAIARASWAANAFQAQVRPA